MKIICFDIGGTKISKAVVAFEGDGYEFFDYGTEINPVRAEAVEKILLEYAQKSREDHQAKKVAISSARLVDPIRKTVSDAVNYYGQEEFSFDFFGKEGFETKIDNDGNCFAAGEYFALKEKPKSLLGLTIGTGIGGGFILDGNIYGGVFGSALEAGHMVVEKDGFVCNCGQKGCWEMYAGGSGIEKYYQRLTKEEKSAKEIFLSLDTNKNAEDTIKFALSYLTLGFINLLNIFDPELVIVGGSLSNQEDFIKEAFNNARKKAFNKKANYQMAISSLKEKANLLGAGRMWEK